jgi:hypothetical protein
MKFFNTKGTCGRDKVIRVFCTGLGKASKVASVRLGLGIVNGAGIVVVANEGNGGTSI